MHSGTVSGCSLPLLTAALLTGFMHGQMMPWKWWPTSSLRRWKWRVTLNWSKRIKILQKVALIFPLYYVFGDIFFLCLRVVEMCKTFQTNVRDMSERYFSRLRRHNYVTPTSYLELILTFKHLLQVKRNEVNTARNRYVIGLQKLDFAASQVTHSV